MSWTTTFIQWKGTDLCMDFICPDCGGNNHFDGYFAHNIRCPDCGSVWEMPTDVQVKKADPEKGLNILESIDADVE